MNDEPKDFRKSMRWSRKGEKKHGGGVGGCKLWVGGGVGGVRPKIRQEMRKENEKKCLPKL